MASKKIKIKINNQEIKIDSNLTILEAAEKINIKIPTLCKIEGLDATGSCRICSVEIKNRANLVTACSTPIQEGMEIFTHSKKVIEARKTIIELLLASNNKNKYECDKSYKSKLQELIYEYEIKEIPFKGEIKKYEIDNSSHSLVRDPNNCILCGRCVQVCKDIQSVEAICFTNRGFNTVVAPPFDYKLEASQCVGCGQCVLNCPTCALEEKEQISEVIDAINDPEITVIAQIAPAVRVSLGEEFGLKPGTIVTTKIVEALKKIGFNRVFDTSFGADLTIMEESKEFINRLNSNKNLPQFTSCCPAWVKFIEEFYPNLIPNLSTTKSPQQMFGTIIKTYYSKKTKIDPKKIKVVSIMPCTAKKSEIERKYVSYTEKDVDFVLTTRETAKLIKQSGIDFLNLKGTEIDRIGDELAEGSGAGIIFGSTGGVMEAALRTVYEKITNKKLKSLDFESVRGLKGIKKATIKIKDKKVTVGVISGLKNAKEIMELIIAKKEKFDFIEVMACPGGCINGGGQPYYEDPKTIELRRKGLYKKDKQKKIRRSYENPLIKQIYKEFLIEPGSEFAKKLIHTKYISKKIN